MTVRTHPLEDELWAVEPVGRIDARLSPALEGALDELIGQGHHRLIVDLSQASYIASAGLKALLTGLRRARASGGDVRLAAVGDRVAEILSMSGFDRVFSVHPSTAQAVQSYRGG